MHLQSRIAPPWLRRFLPTARLIVLLRDPVQRAYSHWKVTLTLTRTPTLTLTLTPTLTLILALTL